LRLMHLHCQDLGWRAVGKCKSLMQTMQPVMQHYIYIYIIVPVWQICVANCDAKVICVVESCLRR
jgi:hypothetical protein